VAEEPSIPVIVERIKNVQEDVTEIKLNMATRTDQAHVDARIAGLVGALEKESAERKADVATERKAREIAIEKEAAERKLVASRLQIVEDRLEARKYNVGISVLLSAVGVVLGILATAGRALLGGG